MPHESSWTITGVAMLMNAFHGFAQEDVRYKTVQSGGFNVFPTKPGSYAEGSSSLWAALGAVWAAGWRGREAEAPVLELLRPNRLLTPRFIGYSHMCNNMKNDKFLPLATWYLRLALGTSFLSAVADRFGIWGHNDAPLVAWGDWPHFCA